ncbi:hypothetical protein SAMN04489798_4390 [Pseudomonas arsenicoxydans]|uniref:Uncharacterized protein n=2 Tax=Pseudomonas arsenicoxydans TaxID=702115 RepID=A0A1H0P210_9PSED|nr:hypothetical protein SAMN04489798_4390 [Pseudomonas arsenicoxydans]
MNRYLRVLAIFLPIIIGHTDYVHADTLKDRMAFWETKVFLCSEGGHSFPSKYQTSSPNEPSECDDGDMTLFNGLLCAAGDVRGCEGVRQAQDTSGRWWRSPRRIGMQAPKYDVSFSPDMALGVLLYLAQTSDNAAFKSWVRWVDDSRPCIAELAGQCVVKGWPRICTDDSQDKRCTFRPSTCNYFELMGIKLGVPEGNLCRRVLQSFGIRADYILPTTEMAMSNAVFNEPGYPMHLSAAEIFLIDKLQMTSVASRAGAVALALRDSKNPFFLFLAEGASQKVRDLVLEQCPSPQHPSRSRTQWAWERTSSDKAYLDSMYWDCIFMGRLLGA